jgi:hypothetical protein
MVVAYLTGSAELPLRLVAIDWGLSHTSRVMATCPLCSERAGKRYCPAKETQICAVCCGTKREVEIDCPSSCSYLKASRSYEAEKRVPDPELFAKVQKFDAEFVERNYKILNAASIIVVQECSNSRWLNDNDVIEVYKALAATMRTLSSGIYYEKLPESPIRLSLFRRLKALIDDLMQPGPTPDLRILKAFEAIDILDFLTVAAEANSSIRPRSRRYVDWVSQQFPQGQQTEHTSGLIIP